MMTMLTGKSLPRRTLLRGLGASLALPFLDAMFPALRLRGQSVPQRVHRFQTFYVPNGMAMPYWTPAAEGTGFELTPILTPPVPDNAQKAARIARMINHDPIAQRIIFRRESNRPSQK